LKDAAGPRWRFSIGRSLSAVIADIDSKLEAVGSFPVPFFLNPIFAVVAASTMKQSPAAGKNIYAKGPVARPGVF
jgi:hypothetical protein